MEFVNRDAELRQLDAPAKRGGLLVVFGRRRVGKTRLLRQWLLSRDGLYRQAIEAQRDLQIQQVFEDVCWGRVPGAGRYWESGIELDLVAPDPDDRKRLLVAEVKWRHLSAAERKGVTSHAFAHRSAGVRT